MSIPKIIHQTYKSHNLPEMYKMCQAEILKLHPDFEYCFYTDDDMDRIIKLEFPDYYVKFNELPRMIMKIDMFRYFLIYKYGGLYIDMDYLMFKPFNLLSEKVVIPCNNENNNGDPICLGNCIFASEPKHPFWKSLIDTLFTIDRNKINYNIDENVDRNILGTGPIFVFDMWKKYSKISNDIYICKKNLFHPPTKYDNYYINNLKSQEVYGIHMCTGLWRNNKL